MLQVSIPNQTLVAAVQFAPEFLNVNLNLVKAQQLAFEACAKGAKVIVLPELCMSGYMLNKQEASQCCQQKDGYQTQSFINLAQKFGAHIVFGYVELCNGDLYNSAAVVGPNGLEGNFQKHNLYANDFLWAKSSNNLLYTVITKAGRLGVLICRDSTNKYRSSHPECPGDVFYKKGNVDTIALLTSWGTGFQFPANSWCELAETLKANVIVSNRHGKEKEQKFKGGCCVINKDLNIQTYGNSFNADCIVGGVIDI